jgi:maltose alpha-D-glucosyltransferase / alpha-amylase
MVTEEERQWMWKEYAPEPRMRLNLGIRRRLAPLLDNDRRKIELAQSLLFSLTGSPILYYGDEIGMGDNIWLDDRNGVRTPMQWQAGLNAGFSRADPSRLYLPVIDAAGYSPAEVNVAAQLADPDSLFHTLQRLISIRRQHPAFGRGKFAWFPVESKAVIAYWRVLDEERLVILNNLSDQTQTVTIDSAILPSHEVYNLLSGEYRAVVPGETITLALKPYEYAWWHL